jgi:hypothetical protein
MEAHHQCLIALAVVAGILQLLALNPDAATGWLVVSLVVVEEFA